MGRHEAKNSGNSYVKIADVLALENGAISLDGTVAESSGDFLAIIPWILLPYDSVTHLLGLSVGATSETLPATALFSVIYLLARGRFLRVSSASQTMFALLMKCVTVILVVTAVNFAVEQFGGFHPDFPSVRVITATRQATSMMLGLTSFLMFQDALLRVRFSDCMSWILVGMIPEFAVIGAQIARHAYRVQGFSPEPADLGDLLVFAFFPACIVASFAIRSRLTGLLAGAAALLRAFSGTALIEGFFVTGAYFIVKRRFVLGAVLMLVVLTCVYVVFQLFPHNYVITLVSYIIINYKTSGHLASGSLVDRLYGLLGPVSLLRTPHAWLGYGFGGDSVYFFHLFPPGIARIVKASKRGFLSISSLQGKMLMYGGLVGFSYYIAAWRKAWLFSAGNVLARVMLIGVFATSLFSLAPFFIPYVWLWLAVACTWKTQRSLRT